MGIVGGALGYAILKVIGDGGDTGRMDGRAYADKSKIETLLGPDVWREIHGKVVIDFGCGAGSEAVEMAARGARRVIGVDIQGRSLREARERAARAGVADRCTFMTATHERAGVIVALDSFEHFEDPAAVLETMAGILRPDGCVMLAFGPTWFHPLGGHLFSVFPWAHLLFTEETLIRWRSDFKTDGATRFREVEGGLNRMTVRRFRRLVEASSLALAAFEPVPIRKLAAFANPLTREFTTAIVRARLVHRRRRAAGQPPSAAESGEAWWT
ncbi:MAG: methyltransferase domain-containing protein [Candidatus Rokubacteria bacterium]|nr:methyltransferase domain-containing protein [Candidatus Rokubacteria bacterium]